MESTNTECHGRYNYTLAPLSHCATTFRASHPRTPSPLLAPKGLSMLERSSALLLLMFAGCATNPVSGKSELSLVSESQETQMGQQGAKEAIAAYGLVDDPAL